MVSCAVLHEAVIETAEKLLDSRPKRISSAVMMVGSPGGDQYKYANHLN